MGKLIPTLVPEQRQSGERLRGEVNSEHALRFEVAIAGRQEKDDSDEREARNADERQHWLRK